MVFYLELRNWSKGNKPNLSVGQVVPCGPSPSSPAAHIEGVQVMAGKVVSDFLPLDGAPKRVWSPLYFRFLCAVQPMMELTGLGSQAWYSQPRCPSALLWLGLSFPFACGLSLEEVFFCPSLAVFLTLPLFPQHLISS